MVSAESQAAMDAARKAVADFMSKNGRHDTTVYERVAAAVYHETVSRMEKEELVTLVDREITQDHYHTSVQPITDSETLEEEHHHNLLPVENRSFEHDDQNDRDLRLEAEMAKFKNEVQHVDGERTQIVIPMVAAEHIHHHVHEIIQPVVTKYTYEPHIIHTTVQIHEKVHNASTHHSMSALPTITMAEFLKQGGILIGREERWDSFEGEPRSVGGTVGASNTNANTSTATSTEPTTTQAADPSIQPEPSAPTRRSSMPATERAPASQIDRPLPTPSAAAITEANKTSEISSPAQAHLQALSRPARSRQSPGRFSLLPLNLARSAGDARIGHQPVKTPLRSPMAQSDSRQASVAGRQGEQRPAGQDQQQGGRG